MTAEIPLVTTRSIVVRSSEPFSAEIDGQMLLMGVDQGLYFGLDEIAGDIWRRLEFPIAVADLCAGLATDYDGESEVITRDVIDLLTRMANRGLVKVPQERAESLS